MKKYDITLVKVHTQYHWGEYNDADMAFPVIDQTTDWATVTEEELDLLKRYTQYVIVYKPADLDIEKEIKNARDLHQIEIDEEKRREEKEKKRKEKYEKSKKERKRKQLEKLKRELGE